MSTPSNSSFQLWLSPTHWALLVFATAVLPGSAEDGLATFAVPKEVRSMLAAHCRWRYIRLPNYGEPGHKTLGNWYTALLNTFGSPIKHINAPDPGVARSGFYQTGAFKQFLV